MIKIIQKNKLTKSSEDVKVPKEFFKYSDYYGVIEQWVEKLNEGAPEHITYVLEYKEEA